MSTTGEQLQNSIAEPEGTHLEFEGARQNYHFDKLVGYCMVLANEGARWFPGPAPANCNFEEPSS